MPESLFQKLRRFLKINEDTKHYKIMHLYLKQVHCCNILEYVQLLGLKWVLLANYWVLFWQCIASLTD